MPRPTALVTMFNKASWGGLHENVWYAATGLATRGWDITVACRQGPMVEKLTADGIDVHVVADWDDFAGDAEVLGRRRWDLVHSHPFHSRRLAQAVVAASGAPLVATFHGNYLDDVASWRGQPAAIVAVSRSHAEMLVAAAGVSPSRITVVPNGVRDHLLDRPAASLKARAADGTTRVVVASRLDRDKRALLECVDAVTDVARGIAERQWVVEVLGDGGDRGGMADFLDAQSAKAPNIRLEHVGWVDSEDVAERLRSATLAVASGRGAAQALAVGTPVVAFGSQGVYGLQHGVNLENGLWGNFGGFPLTGRAVTDVRTDVTRLLTEPGFFKQVRVAGRIAARTHLLQSGCDDTLHRLYEQVAGEHRPSGRGRLRRRR